MMQGMISNILMNDVVTPIKLVMSERRKMKKRSKGRLRSMYRDLLNLSFVSLGRENIDHGQSIPTHRGHPHKVFSMLGQRRRWWANIETTLDEYLVFA